MKKSLFLSVLLCVSLFTACGRGEVINADVTLPAGQTETTLPALSETATTQQFSQPASEAYTEETSTETVSEASTEAPPQSAETTAPVTEALTEGESTTQYELKKTGEMAFSDSADNKYLAAVAKKYNLDTSLLAAIYTVPDNNGNIVLYFDGTTDESGRLVRTADTLKAVYSIDAQLNSECASEDKELNECSFGEMKVILFTVTKHIMPQFEKELNG